MSREVLLLVDALAREDLAQRRRLGCEIVDDEM